MFLDFILQAAGSVAEITQETAAPVLKDNELLALIGGVIVAGFLGNLIFKYAKIPSVIKLMGLGVLLGPVLGFADPEALLQITPFFGKVALLIILFAGGLKLNIETVIAQLGKAVLLAVLAFGLTFALAFAASYYWILPGQVLQSFILSTLMAGTASSIVIPVVNKLSVSEEVKSLLAIESALSNLLILVVVIIACDFSLDAGDTGSNDFLPIVGDFLLKIVVSLAMAVVFGIIWSRIMGAMRKESLAYMLTLGFIFLLNYLVDRFGGSGPISILFFAIVLANVSRTTAAWAPRLQAFFGIQVDATNFALNEFLKGISEELSFLVTTFFFVLLGCLITFDSLGLDLLINIGILTGCILIGRAIVGYIFTKVGKKRNFGVGEPLIIYSMMPRGLATAIMAFLPASAAYMIPNTEAFPTYAMFAILTSNLIMTLFVTLGEIRLKRAGVQIEDKKPGEETEAPQSDAIDTSPEAVAEFPSIVIEAEIPEPVSETETPEPDQKPLETDPTTTHPPVKLKSFTEHLYSWLKVEEHNFRIMDQNSVRAIKLRDLIFWIRVIATVLVTTLGILMDRSEVVLVAMLFSPIAPLVNTIGISILTGDVYMFLKGSFKTILMVLAIIGVSTLVTLFLPFTGLPEQVSSRMTPTVLDFALAVLGGLITPVVLLRGKRLENLAITPIISILVFPPLVILGYGFGAGSGKDSFGEIVGGGALSFSANFTAMLVGILISQWILQLTQHKASAYIKAWKEKEIEHGELHKWFERLHLVRFLEFVGNPFARVFVLAVLSAALFVPLSTTLYNVVEDYNISETIALKAYENFEIENRSSIISTEHSRHDTLLTIKIKVATSEFFKQEDVKSFEDEVYRELEMPVRLSLVQSQGTIDFASGLAVNEANEDFLDSDPKSVARAINRLKSNLQGAVETLPAQDGIKVFAYGTDFGMDSAAVRVHLEYLAPRPLNAYTENLMQLHVSEKLGMPTGSILLEYYPNRYFGNGVDPATFSDSTGKFSPLYILKHSGPLTAWVDAPQGDSVARKNLIRELGYLNRAVEIVDEPEPGNRFSIRFE